MIGDLAALFRAGGEHLRASMYLGGYAVECKLKAIAMEVHDVWSLRELAVAWAVPESDVFGHRLEALIERLPLRDNMKKSGVWRDFAGRVGAWRPSWRYDPHKVSEERALAFLEATDRVYKWLDSNRC